MVFASTHFCCVDALIKNVIIVNSNCLTEQCQKKFWVAKLVTHANKILLVTKFKLGNYL